MQRAVPPPPPPPSSSVPPPPPNMNRLPPPPSPSSNIRSPSPPPPPIDTFSVVEKPSLPSGKRRSSTLNKWKEELVAESEPTAIPINSSPHPPAPPPAGPPPPNKGLPPPPSNRPMPPGPPPGPLKPVSAPPPPKPPGEQSGGFNTDMLNRAKILNQSKTNTAESNAVDSDEGWSEEEDNPPPPIHKSHSPSLLVAGDRSSTGKVIKKANYKPPEVSKPPPARPPPLPIPANIELRVSRESKGEVETKSIEVNSIEDNHEVVKEVETTVVVETDDPEEDEDILPIAEEPIVETEQQVDVVNNGIDASESSNQKKTIEINEIPNDKESPSSPPPVKSKRVSALTNHHDNASVLVEEVVNLKKQLSRAEARLKQDGVAASITRELELEKELEEAYRKTYKLKMGKQALEASVEELQLRLTRLESDQIGGRRFVGISPSSSSIEIALKKGEREKQLELLLQKTKKDKDKAIRFIIEIIGKDRVTSFLNQNAGSTDILDRLLDFHLSNVSNNSSTSVGKSINTTSSASGNRQQSKLSTEKGEKRPANYRSRIDEYFRSAINSRDT